MITKDFYGIIDNELNTIIEENKNDIYIKKHHSAIDNQKSYALLIWFLQFYRKANGYFNSLTDGNNDKSCDIVFDRQNNKGEKIFYIVQSKWNNAKNVEKETSKDEILKALTEFNTILKNEKLDVNERLAERLKELDIHVKANGEVKFIFLSLAHYTGAADADIKTFKKSHPKTQFEVIDIDRLKSDYIERTYKGISPINPLEKQENAETSPIDLRIERLNKNGGNIIKIEKPFDAYIFLLRPKMIHELFEKFNFGLFFKNVRNPLLESKFNEQIESTAINNPAFFWYYNNGITGITNLMPNEIRNEAETIKLSGLQIINGAQTVYAVYRAYENAGSDKRLQLDADILITLRLFRSGGTDFDLNVTRFTNSQNPVTDRDFHANDDVQIRLQEESFNTKIWYEKRQDEFRVVPKRVEVVHNNIFGGVYLAYQLQESDKVYENANIKNMTFISIKDNKDGLYEKIFNEKTKFEDMLCAYYVFDVINYYQESIFEELYETSLYSFLALMRPTFDKYFNSKFGEAINVNRHLIKIYENNDRAIIRKCYIFLKHFVKKMLEQRGFISIRGNPVRLTDISIRDFIQDIQRLENLPEEIENIQI